MLNEIFQSAVLGIAQGLGEFLPISSTAHLIIIPYLFHWEDPGLAFDVALHFGTLIAVVAFFWRDWITILKLPFQDKMQSSVPNSRENIQNYSQNTIYLLIIATIPGILVGYYLEDKAETVFRHPLIIASTLALMGLILYLSDRYSKKMLTIKNIDWKKSIVIGLSQAIAIIPGVSRSGTTMSAALAAGINRKDAARFSFLLSTPIIFGASIIKLPELIGNGLQPPILTGIIFSAVSGYLAIKYLLKLIEKTGYFPFFIYRLALALIIGMIYLASVR